MRFLSWLLCLLCLGWGLPSVAADDEEAPERFRGIGIRIEDDILISDAGPINLTESVPKTISEIEAIVGTAE